MQNNYQVGQRVIVKIKGIETEATYAGFNEKYGYPIVEVGGQQYNRNILRVVDTDKTPTTVVTTIEEFDTQPPKTAVTFGHKPREFDINQRFIFMAKLVKMIATATPVSLLIVGDGGLGKSHTTKSALEEAGMEEDHDFKIIKGFSTPKALYRSLYDHNDKIIVFDDCDSVIKNDTSVGLLKSALEQQPIRTVSWLTEHESQDLPANFTFRGKIIFISNLRLNQVSQAILSRSMIVDVTMTANEKIARMRHIAKSFKVGGTCELPETEIDEIIGLIERLKNVAKELSMRTFDKVAQIKKAEPTCWLDLAEYTVTTGI